MKIKPDFPGRCRCLSFCLRVAALLLAILSGFPASAATGQKMELTVYEDGKSCPKGCNDHVVFNKKHNGTANAFLASHPIPPYKRCNTEQPCRICFETEARHCMDVEYGGEGPNENKFDVTPAFMKKHCGEKNLPPEVASICRTTYKKEQRYLASINCIKHPQHEKCRAVMEEADKKQRDDLLIYKKCIKMGEDKFNKQVNAEEQRSNDCAYTKNVRNPRTGYERILLPGACHAGTYVGRDGLDCCSGIPANDSKFDIECDKFYPKP